MRLSINEGYFRKVYSSNQRKSFEESIRICKAGGFDTVDFALGSATPEGNIILRENFIDEAQSVRTFCDNLGVSINQTHARYDYYNLSEEEFISQMIKTVQVSKILGADNVVVHADTYYNDEFEFDFDKVLKIIYDIYAPMVEEAKKQNIKIAMETLFEDRAPKGARARFTSYVDELDAIVSMYNDDAVGICWDFGHAKVSYGGGQFEQMKKVGDKIISTHVHDNFYKIDMHAMPLLGDTNWELGMKTLKEIGYKGDLTFELVYGCLPEHLNMDFLKLNSKVGKFLIDRFDAY